MISPAAMATAFDAKPGVTASDPLCRHCGLTPATGRASRRRAAKHPPSRDGSNESARFPTTSRITRKKGSMGLIWFVVIGAIAGWAAGQFMKGNGFGLLGDIVVGVIGAFIGG